MSNFSSSLSPPFFEFHTLDFDFFRNFPLQLIIAYCECWRNNSDSDQAQTDRFNNSYRDVSWNVDWSLKQYCKKWAISNCMEWNNYFKVSIKKLNVFEILPTITWDVWNWKWNQSSQMSGVLSHVLWSVLNVWKRLQKMIERLRHNDLSSLNV